MLNDAKEMIFDNRVDWPFATMEIGQIVKFEDPETARKAQPYAHTYAQKSGKRFKTRKRSGVMYVQRLK
jgi:hypothetical protein